MREVEVYQTSDSVYFKCADKAIKHQEDIIGEMLDDLIPHDDRGNITRVDRHNLLMKMLNDKELHLKIKELQTALEYR